MTIGTLFTLYVVPAMYLYIGRDYAAVAAKKAAKAHGSTPAAAH